MAPSAPSPSRLLALSAVGEEDGEPPLPTSGGDFLVEWGHPLRVAALPGPLDAAVARLAAFGAIALTSPRAVHALRAALDRAGLPVGVLVDHPIAALDGRTAEAVRSALSARPAVLARGGGAALGEALRKAALPGPVLFPRAAAGRDELPAAAAGLVVEVVPAYDTLVDTDEVARLVRAHAEAPWDAVAVASPRAALALLDGGFPLGATPTGAIGATTEAALRARGIAPVVVASRPAFAVLLDELAATLARRQRIR